MGRQEAVNTPVSSDVERFSTYSGAVEAAIARKKELGEDYVYPATLFPLDKTGKLSDHRRDLSGDVSLEIAMKNALAQSPLDPPVVEVHWHKPL